MQVKHDSTADRKLGMHYKPSLLIIQQEILN